MRRASAAARHLAWLLTFAALLLLPLLSLTLPPRPVPVLPAAPLVPASLAAPLVASPVTAPPAPLAARPDAVDFRLPATAPVLPAHVRRAAPIAWPLGVCLFWLGGAGLAVFPLGMGWVGAVRRLRHCPPVSDPAILALAAEAGRLVGVRRPIALRSGPRVAVPVTFGLLRPVVLLPEGAASWPAGRLRVALLHELAHVRRGDWTAQTLARLACALFWHNPLAWLGARRLRAEAERACDDLVLSSGIPALDYAQHLLAMAAALSGANRPLSLAVPMAVQAPLESRLRAVLTIRPRRAPSRRLAVLAFVLALVVLVPLAVLRPAARAARRTAPPPLAPVLLFALPRAVRPAPAPVKAAVAAPPVPVPTQPTPIGVPPMKPPMPVKATALAALAAGLALPTAQAQPTAPVGHASASTLANTRQIEAVLKDLNARTKAYPIVTAADALHWNTIALHHANLKTIMAQMPWGPDSKNPVGVRHIFYLLGDNAILVHATPAGFAQVQEVVKGLDVAPESPSAAPSAAPRQVQLKFEWVSAASTASAAPDKSVDALIILAEEGRKAQASTQHLQNGTGGRETITVLARVQPGGVVVLDITEHSETTARAGETVSSDSQTTVSVKDGETGTVGGLTLASQPSRQNARRLLFVTPTIVRPAE